MITYLKISTIIIPLVFVVVVLNMMTVATTWYVRTDGGTAAQCTGRSNTAYPGSGTLQACAFSNMQDALNAATFGDTIKLHAGDTISTQSHYAFGEWILADKGTPPTNTDADYITITTDDPSGTPTALSGYPVTSTRITTALAANMPHAIAEGSTPLFRIRNGAKYWKIERLDIHNNSANGWQTIVFFNNDDPGPNSLIQVPHHIAIQSNWIHPAEEVGTVLTSDNVNRSAENAIYLQANNVTIQNNAIQGFVGRVRYGGEAGSRMASAGWLTGGTSNTAIVQNNLIEAWTYAFFSGGSRMPDYAVTNGGTIVSCSSTTVCTFSNVTNLNVGDPLSVYVNSVATWGATFVQSKSGNIVTFTAPLCHSYDGNNSCTTITGNPTPAANDSIRWKGLQVDNITLRQNIFAHYPEWAPLMNGDCGGKGYLELKSGTNIVFDGNTFTGCTGPTVTVRNQVGDYPWASLDGLTFSNNYWTGNNRPFTSFLRDSSPTPKSQNVTWTNNLYVGLAGNADIFPGGELSGNTGGGINVTFTHNTVAWSKTNTTGMTLNAWHNFITFLTNNGYSNTMQNLTIQNNILGVAPNICFPTGAGGSSLPISDCWPEATINHNVLVNADSYLNSDINSWWLTAYPSNTLVVGYAAVGFTSTDSNLDSSGNYRLLNSSPYHNAASDGTDIGVNYTTLVNHLGYDPNGLPTPTPTPTPTSTPTPTPSPSPTPTVSISGATTLSGSGLGGVSVRLLNASDRSLISSATSTGGSGAYTLSGTQGTSVIVSPAITGYTFNPSEILYSTISGNKTQNFAATAVVTPTPTPTPLPTPTPTPSPTPTPVPTPTPTLPICKPNQTIGNPPVCQCVTKPVGPPNNPRCKP